MTDLVILVPVLRRPHRIVPLMESIETTMPRAFVLFIASPSDHDEKDALLKAGVDFIVMDNDYEGRGDYARKINKGYEVTTEPLIFLGADDLKFHRFWYENALMKMQNRIGVVGTNDLGNPRVLSGRHSTHSLVLRDYVDRHGTVDEEKKILHEGYTHCFVDDELIATAKKRRAWAFSKGSVVEHLHPNYKKTSYDDVYESGIRHFKEDAELFRRRSRLFR